MKRKTLFLLITLSSICICYSQKSDNYFNQGVQKVEKKDYYGAIEAFNKALELNDFRTTEPHGDNYSKSSIADDKTISYWYRGIAKGEIRDFTGAILDYNEAIKHNNTSLAHENIKRDNKTSLYMERGYIKFELGDYRGAILDYDLAWGSTSSTNQKSTLAYYKGLAYEGLHNYDLAKQSYNSAIFQSRSKGKYYYNLGLVEIKLGEKNNGCLNLSKAGELGIEDAYNMIRKYCN